MDAGLTPFAEMGIRVEERSIAIDEVVEAHERGLLRGCFGAGTAATVAHVSATGYEGR